MSSPSAPVIIITRTGDKFPPHGYDPNAPPGSVVVNTTRRNGQIRVTRRAGKPIAVRPPTGGPGPVTEGRGGAQEVEGGGGCVGGLQGEREGGRGGGREEDGRRKGVVSGTAKTEGWEGSKGGRGLLVVVVAVVCVCARARVCACVRVCVCARARVCE